MSGFSKPLIATRVFEIELKHRKPEDATGEDEILIATEQVRVPDLHNREWEKRWVICSAWNNFSSPECQKLGINQVFVFTQDFKELVIRLEINPFQDEQAEILQPPPQEAYEAWLVAVKQRFKKLYGCDLKDWEKSQCGV